MMFTHHFELGKRTCNWEL